LNAAVNTLPGQNLWIDLPNPNIGTKLCHNQVSISPIFYEQLFHMKVFCTAFMCLQLGFVIFWRKDFGTKAAHKMLVKMTPG
jgi:hypothetical protein